MIFNINFFLFCFAQSNIWSYTCVYAKHYASITNDQYGTLAMLLPVLALIAKPIACSLTDAHGIHRQFLIGSLAIFGLSYGSLGLIPFFKDPEDHSTDAMAWMVISILMSIGYIACSCVFCMNDALASNYARKHNKSYSIMRIFACSGWSCGALFIMLVGELEWLPFMVFGCSILVLFTTADIMILVLWPYPEDFEMFHDGSTIEQRKLSIVGPNTMALMARKKPRGSISRDMLERIRAGRSKSVGGLPRAENPAFNAASEQKLEEPKEYTNFQCQMILLKMIASKHKSFIRHIVLFTMFGIANGVIQNYEFDYLKERIVQNEANFEFFSKFCMIAQSVFGEILINIVATEMLRMFGANANVSLALVAIGLRSYFYANILPYVGPYSVVVAEALQGPSLGLYWVLTVDVGSNYALMVTEFMPELKRRGIVRDKRQEEEINGCLRATMIGIMSSSMEGLGTGLGALLGGKVSQSMNYEVLWNICALLGFAVGFMNIGWDLIRKLVIKKKPKEKLVANLPIPTVIIDDSMVKLANGEVIRL